MCCWFCIFYFSRNHRNSKEWNFVTFYGTTENFLPNCFEQCRQNYLVCNQIPVQFHSICRNFFRGRIIWPLRCGQWRDESIWQHAQPRGGDSHTAGLMGNSLLTGSSLWSHIVNVMDINKLQCSTMLFRKV